MIRFESVTKHYPDGTTAVGGLTLEAPSNTITVFVGPSGCGKTTALRMINRMIEPTSGSLWIDDRDVAGIKPTELRRGIGYVIQQAGLFPNKTVLDNIATVPQLLGRSKRQARGTASELLERVGLPRAFAHRYPTQLSGGQQQRVGVARALAADPPILLMDEPFSAVDPVVRAQLQDELLHLQADLAKTIVFVTHDIDEAIKLGDQIAVLRPGGLVAQFDTPEKLLSTPADPFVAEFVGRDRGYRALGFREAGTLPLRPELTVTIGQHLRGGTVDDEWMLVLDPERRPLGWLSRHSALLLRGEERVTDALLNLGGTLTTEAGTLREALDAALSSPSGRGVVVDAEGHFAGTITAPEVLARIQQTDARFNSADGAVAV